jgi:hypothetical protein
MLPGVTVISMVSYCPALELIPETVPVIDDVPPGPAILSQEEKAIATRAAKNIDFIFIEQLFFEW